MNSHHKLFMLLLGARVPGRFTEQHDIFLSIGSNVKDLIPDIKACWPGTKDSLHIDAWREITCVDGHAISIIESNVGSTNKQAPLKNLFFLNLGGYCENEFEEFHHKVLTVAADMDAAKKQAKKTVFFKQHSLSNNNKHHNASAHIDDKYGIDVDDIYAVKDILPPRVKTRFTICIDNSSDCRHEDEIHLGYFRLKDLQE